MKLLERNKVYSTTGDLIIALEVILVPVSLYGPNSPKTENRESIYGASRNIVCSHQFTFGCPCPTTCAFGGKESISSFRQTAVCSLYLLPHPSRPLVTLVYFFVYAFCTIPFLANACYFSPVSLPLILDRKEKKLNQQKQVK
jgi:hypothetical protein